jgi:hypothetical protein
MAKEVCAAFKIIILCLYVGLCVPVMTIKPTGTFIWNFVGGLAVVGDVVAMLLNTVLSFQDGGRSNLSKLTPIGMKIRNFLF